MQRLLDDYDVLVIGAGPAGMAAAAMGFALSNKLLIIAGALIGAAIQQELGKSEGMEYIIKTGKSNKGSGNTKKKKEKRYNSESVSDSITDSIDTDMKTDLVTVVQGGEEVLRKGQHVYVIYTDGRARVVSAE